MYPIDCHGIMKQVRISEIVQFLHHVHARPAIPWRSCIPCADNRAHGTGSSNFNLWVLSVVDLSYTLLPNCTSLPWKSDPCVRLQGLMPSASSRHTLSRRQKHLIAHFQKYCGRPTANKHTLAPLSTSPFALSTTAFVCGTPS